MFAALQDLYCYCAKKCASKLLKTDLKSTAMFMPKMVVAVNMWISFLNGIVYAESWYSDCK